jgi:hypothetical protein
MAGWRSSALRLVGGSLSGAAATAFLSGLCIVVFGMAPGPLAAYLLENPPPFLTHWSTPIIMTLIGLVLMAGALVANMRTASGRAADELAELRSEGIHEILNRPIKTQLQYDLLVRYEADWQKRVVAVLERYFGKAEVLHFTRIGTMTATSFQNSFNPQHNHFLMMFAAREARLRELITRNLR